MNKKQLRKMVNPLFYKGICHRGLHNEHDIENGLRAFENALKVQMAIELDVHITLDNEIVVIHDSDLKRLTGKEGIVENLTLEEIQSNYLLLDGEHIPTLNEVFDLIKEEVPIVLELKVYENNQEHLCNYVKQVLKRIMDKKNIIIISFDSKALNLFKNEGYIRQLLVSPTPQNMKFKFLRDKVEGFDMHFDFLKEKRIQSYSKRHSINVWTINSRERFEEALQFADFMTFQNMDPNYVKEQLTLKNF